jgi:ADP-ribose pyrophosphatase YjhB (NUDIX family)
MNNIRPNALVIIQKNNQLLAQKGLDKNTGKVFYRLLGGGIEFGESSNETLRREIKEELNATISNEKLLCVIENVFEFNSKKGHEITFIYSGDLLEENLYNQKTIKISDKADEHAEWVPVDRIKSGNAILYPKEAVNYL